MSGWSACTCKGTWKEKRKNWRIQVYQGNYSYFEKPQGAYHSSNYSLIVCLKCVGMFRTKAKYVDNLKFIKK